MKVHEERPAHLPVVEFVTPYGNVAVGGCEPSDFADALVRTFFAAATESWRGQVPVLPQIKETAA